MGLLGSRWEAAWEGHALVVIRNEWTKGFKLECDGEEVAGKSTSLVGTGELNGEITHDGRRVPVRVAVDSSCEIYIAGASIPVQTIK